MCPCAQPASASFPALWRLQLDFYLEYGKLPEDYKYYYSVAHSSGANHMAHLSEELNKPAAQQAQQAQQQQARRRKLRGLLSMPVP